MATTEIYTLSLHDALPISSFGESSRVEKPLANESLDRVAQSESIARKLAQIGTQRASLRSEEHTSELQSRQYLVCRLLLEKKKKKQKNLKHKQHDIATKSA